MMTWYRKKPVVIEAIQWFKIGDHPKVTPHSQKDGSGWIKTLEGGHIVTPGDWIIKGVAGEFYPCKPDIFAMTYEPATGKEVMPSEPNGSAGGPRNTAPAGLSAGGGAPVTVQEAARVLLAWPAQRAVFDACSGVVKVYRFNAVLQSLSALPVTEEGAETAAKVLRTLEKQTAHGQRAEHSRIGHCFNEASWHIHLAGFRSRSEAQAALDAILAAQPATKGGDT